MIYIECWVFLLFFFGFCFSSFEQRLPNVFEISAMFMNVRLASFYLLLIIRKLASYLELKFSFNYYLTKCIGAGNAMLNNINQRHIEINSNYICATTYFDCLLFLLVFMRIFVYDKLKQTSSSSPSSLLFFILIYFCIL